MFTLIELLVVIAVLLILLALLLPVLGRVRNITEATVCTNNLRQLYAGVVLYASEDADNYLPPFHMSDTAVPGHNEGYSPTSWYYLYSWGSPHGYPAEYWDLGWMNLGLLYTTGLLTEGDIYYCPGIDSGWLQRDHYEPWPTPGPDKGRIRSSYYLNPHATVSGGATGQGTRIHDRMGKTIPPETIMLMDFIWLDTDHMDELPERNAHWELFSWNITRADGSSQRVTPSRNDMLALGPDWRLAGVQNWEAFLDALEILEK